jgi:hypothetical protein
VKLFYTSPVVNAEMLVMMLEKHGIAATQAFADPAAPDDGDLSRPPQLLQSCFHFPAITQRSRSRLRCASARQVAPTPG